MTRSIRSLAGALASGVLLAVAPGAAADSSVADSSVGGEILAAAAAANRFLGMLDPAQARAAVLPAPARSSATGRTCRRGWCGSRATECAPAT